MNQEQQFAAALASLTPAQKAAYLAKNPGTNPYKGNDYIVPSSNVAKDYSAYDAAFENHPITQQYKAAGNTIEEIDYAATTGDLSGIKNHYGQPFKLQEQQDALKQAEDLDKAFYEQQKTKETADAESALAQKQADYQNYLLTSGQNFQEDRATLNQKMVDQGVLFSGANAQKQRSLKQKYEQDQAYKQGTLGRQIASEAQDYQYKYGNNAAQGLSQYYNLGGNTYGLNTNKGEVGSSGLSSIYNPSQYNYAGTRIGEQAGQANRTAANLLASKSNKFLSTGYKYQA